MKNNLKVLMCVVGMLVFTASRAQVPQAVMTNTGVTTTEVEGSPYLDEKFVPGVVYHDNTSNRASLRYNMHLDVMEYTERGLTMALDAGPNINKVVIGKDTYVVRKFDYKKKSKYGYLTVLDSGKVTLYCKKVANFYAAKKGSPPDFKDRPAMYERANDVFYYQMGDGELHQLESMKSMIATLPEKQEELAQYVKKEKISASKEQKVLQFVQYINSL